MKLNLIEGGGNVGSRDITAFYGVNRTAKINDFELSDTKNFDCDSFPHIATRKARELFYNENEMALICGDTDIYDDYKVTGVTKTGLFVYRGKRISRYSGDLIGLGLNLSGSYSVAECMGDYVFFPSKTTLSVNESIASGENVLSGVLGEFNSVEGGFVGNYICDGSTNQSAGTYSTITSDTIRLQRTKTIDATGMFLDFFFSGVSPGQCFKLDLLCKQGSMDNPSVYRCKIPNDVYMVIQEMYFTAGNYSGNISYGDSNFNRSFAHNAYTNGYAVWMYIKYAARSMITNELCDISDYIECYHNGKTEIESDTAFLVGKAYESITSDSNDSWNDFNVNLISSPMVMGRAFSGRLFTCDNLGVTVYYSSASDKYDFKVSATTGGAGYISCADPGKWTAMCVFNEVLYVFKRNGMYRIYSSDGLAFYMEQIADMGALSNDAVCVVDNVMYFLSENGLCRFLGSYPELLPDSLGKKYLRGVLGGSDGKIFASLTYKDGEEEKQELCVWHSDKQIFSVHDDFKAEKFVSAAGELYALSGGEVYKMECGREPLEFSLDTKNYFFSFTKKGVNGARLYFDFSGNEGEYFEVFVSYDGGEFEPCFKPITNGKVKYVPIKLKKCDEVKLRISGKGVFTLKGLSFSLYQGGDIRQNR